MKNKNLLFKTLSLFMLVILTGFITTLKCQTIQIDSTFTTDAEIFPFSANDTVYGLKLSGNVQLNSDTSLLRVIFSDEYGQEFIIYEAYPLIVTENNFSVEDVCDETCYLNQLLPYSVRIEVINASFYFDELNCFGDFQENIVQLQYDAKRTIDFSKIDTINLNIQNYGMRWVAADNNIVELFYKNKKSLFGENYNLRGFDYYSGGIFELLGYKNYEKDTSLLIKYFDWRNRHGANREGSPYFDGDTLGTGWLTSVKNQSVPQNCGSCYAFTVIGEVEAVTNLYFNQHIDLNLSEQELVCDTNNQGCFGGVPSKSLDYVKENGVITEYCLPYFAHDDSCNILCQSIDTLISIYNKSSVSAYYGDDTVKKILISKGPLAWWYQVSMTQSHAVIICGYLVDPIDSTTIWICKNSLGLNWGCEENGFCYLDIPIESNPRYIITPVYAQMPDTLEVQCLDEDGDGYCFWGIGSKPAGCNCPDQQDCDDSNPFLGPYDENFYCSCLFNYDSIPLIIINDTTWTDPIYLAKDVIIDNNSQLTIKNIAGFIEGTRIIVKPGSKLMVDGGILTKACDDNWMGVEVWGNPDTTQNFTSLQGYLKIENNGKIEFAQTAVFTGKKSYNGNIIDGYEGGIVQAKDAIFLNNKIDVEFRPYQNMHPFSPGTEMSNLSHFYNCEFFTDLNENQYIEYDTHIILRNVKGINFYGCDFKFIDPYFGLTTGENGTGILCYDASFSILPLCTDPNVQPCIADDSCRFINLKYGIRAFNNGDTRIIRIKEAIFTQNTGGIYLSGYIQSEIISNRLYCGTQLPPQKNQNNIAVNTYGLYLDNCSGYHIENNTFYEKRSPSGFSQSKAFGIYVKNSGQDANEIYNNFLHNLSYGIVAAGINRGEESGLCIKCNELNNNVNDIFVVPDSNFIESRYLGIAEYQGADTSITTAMAGNTFTPFQIPISYDNNFYNYYNDFDCGYINYFHHQRQFDPLTYPLDSNYTRETISLHEYYELQFIKDDACPSRINGGGNDPRGEMAAADGHISTNQNQLDALVDGGNTQDLNYDVMFSMPDEALQIRQQLLNESPYLSDTVMKQAINKENVLPNAMVRDVLIANPQSAKTNEILTALDERFVPMPDYMMAEIMQGSQQSGAKEVLESKLGFWQNYYSRAKNKLIRNFLTDTLILYPYDSLITLYQNESDLNSKYRLAFSYFYNKQLSQALNTITDITVEFELDNFQTAIHQNYEDYFDILQTMFNNGWNAGELDTTSVSTLLNITDNDHPLISAYARGMLLKGGHIDYTEQLLLPASYKSSPVYNIYPSQIKKPETDHLKLFPNPAGNYVILEYDLREIFVNCMVIISDMNGKMVDSFMLKDKQNQIILNLKDKPNGIYIFNLYAGNELLETEKLTISK